MSNLYTNNLTKEFYETKRDRKIMSTVDDICAEVDKSSEVAGLLVLIEDSFESLKQSLNQEQLAAFLELEVLRIEVENLRLYTVYQAKR